MTVREKPILFCGDMVRGIQDGSKSETRRVMKPQPSEGWEPHSYGEVHKMDDGDFVMKNGEPVVIGWGPSNRDGDEAYPCPYGRPGSHLWVKETFYPMPHLNAKAYFRASDPLVGVKWKPSIFMPRHLSRITLENISVRVERVQDITEEGAIAEGCKQAIEITPGRIPKGKVGHRTGYGLSYRRGYKQLWDSLNAKRDGGKYAWDKNPRVWVIQFRKL